LTDARSDASYYQQQVEKLRNDNENEKKKTADLQANLVAILGLSSSATGAKTRAASRRNADEEK